MTIDYYSRTKGKHHRRESSPCIKLGINVIHYFAKQGLFLCIASMVVYTMIQLQSLGFPLEEQIE